MHKEKDGQLYLMGYNPESGDFEDIGRQASRSFSRYLGAFTSSGLSYSNGIFYTGSRNLSAYAVSQPNYGISRDSSNDVTLNTSSFSNPSIRGVDIDGNSFYALLNINNGQDFRIATYNDSGSLVSSISLRRSGNLGEKYDFLSTDGTDFLVSYTDPPNSIVLRRYSTSGSLLGVWTPSIRGGHTLRDISFTHSLIFILTTTTQPSNRIGEIRELARGGSAWTTIYSDGALDDFTNITSDNFNLYALESDPGIGAATRASRVYFYLGSVSLRITFNLSGGETLSGTVLFQGGNIGDIEADDFEILTDANVSTTGWTITVNGSSTAAVNVSDNGTINFRATPPSNTRGDFKVRIGENTVNQGTGTANAPSEDIDSNNYSVNSYPIVSVSSFTAPTGLRRDTSSTFRLTLDRSVPVSDVTSNDFSFVAITSIPAYFNPTTVLAVSPSNNTSNTFDISIGNPPNGTGRYLLRLAANSIPERTTYRQGPTSPFNSEVVEYNTTPLGIWNTLLSFCGTSNTVSSSIRFLESVTDFSGSDIRVVTRSNVVLSTWTHIVNGSGTSYTISSTPPNNSNDVFRLRLLPDRVSFRGQTGPINNIDSNEINVDNRLTGVGGDEVAMFWSDLTGGISLSGRLTVTGQNITGLAASDFEVITAASGTTESRFSIVLDPSGSSVNAGAYVMVTATRTSALRTETRYRLRLKEDSVTANSMDSPSMNIDSNDIYFNSYTVWGTASYCRTDNELSAVMTFGTTVRSIASGDFDVIDQTDTAQAGWTIELTPSTATTRAFGQTLTVKATAPSNISDIFRLRLKQNTVRLALASTNNHPLEDVITNPVSVNNIVAAPVPEAPVAEAFWSDLTGGTNLTGRINFVGKDVSNLAAADFDVIFASSRAREANFTITLDPTGTTATAGSYVTVTATRSGSLRTETDYRLRLKQNSIRSTGSTTDDTPSVNIDSNAIHFNSYTIWGTASYCETDNELTAVLSFGSLIRGISAADFDVIDQTETTQSNWTIAIEPTGTTSRTLGQTLTVKATAASNVSGIFRLRLQARTMRVGAASTDNHPTEAIVTNEVSINNITVPEIPEDVSEAFWTDLTGGTSLSGRIHFVGKDVSNVAAADFDAIFATSGAREPQFTITLDPTGTTATAGSYITVTATRTSQLRTESNYKLRLKQNSIRSTGSTSDDTPAVNIDSNPIYFNSYTVWGTASYCETDNEFSAVMTFGTLIRSLAVADFDVIDSTNTAQPDWTITFEPSGTTSRTFGQTLTVKAAAPTNVAGVFRLRLKASTVRTGAATSDNHPTQDVLTNPVRIGNISTITPTVDRSQAFWSNLVGGPTLTGDLTFAGTGVTGIDASDFQVHLALTGIRDVDFTITVSAASASQGQSVTVIATPGGSYSRDADYQLRLTAQSMMMTGSMENDFPIGTIDSNSIHLNTIIIWGDSEGGTSISCPLTFRSDIINLGTDDFEVIDETDTIQDTWVISFNPSGVTTRDIGEQLTVTGTPPATELISDVYRLRMKPMSVAFEGTTSDTIPTQEFSSPPARVNNLETDLTLPSPYLIATVPTGTASTADPFTTLQTPTNNPNRVITLTITSYVDRVETNISNLRATDFVITSDAGSLTATLT